MDTSPIDDSPQSFEVPVPAPQAHNSESSALVLAAVPVESSTPETAAELLTSQSETIDAPSHAVPAHIRALPVQLDIRIPLASFRLRELKALAPGTVLETEWPATEDLPFGSGDTQLLWVGFEVVDLKLAARITRVA